MSNQKPQKANLDDSSTKTMGNVSMQMAEMQGATVVRATINPGGSWAKDLKEAAGTSSCQKGHVGYVLSGQLAIEMDDGNKETFGQGDAFMVPPGHNEWCEGDEAAVFVEFSKGADYYAH